MSLSKVYIVDILNSDWDNGPGGGTKAFSTKEKAIDYGERKKERILERLSYFRERLSDFEQAKLKERFLDIRDIDFFHLGSYCEGDYVITEFAVDEDTNS